MSFVAENIPYAAMKMIISKMIKDINCERDVKEIIGFLGMNKFLNGFFNKENIIEEIYDTLKDKKLIKKKFIESDIDSKDKILTFLQEGFCFVCDNLIWEEEYEVEYYKSINTFACKLCIERMTVDIETCKSKYFIGEDILEDVEYFEDSGKKTYFIKDIEKKINMPIYEYIGVFAKNSDTSSKKDKYYLNKKIRDIVREKGYDSNVAEICICSMNSLFIYNITSKSPDKVYTKNEKIDLIIERINVIKSMEYDFDVLCNLAKKRHYWSKCTHWINITDIDFVIDDINRRRIKL